ncbi:hypothetical protein RRG08_004581 [Elysia crispata]|uniref:Uncharacterized protein n=1 Tax=Elysia crispata TaxID=231223 RepID=A0AAE1E091_9GAST|nr:hypothetical protein RRG08_004581 [Elysia crispata]
MRCLSRSEDIFYFEARQVYILVSPMEMSEKGQSSSQWNTYEAKSVFFLLRDEFEKIKQMPILKRYKEMERTITIFTADDVLHKLFVLTREGDREEFMLALTSVAVHSNEKESDRYHILSSIFSEERQNSKKNSSCSINSSPIQVQTPVSPSFNCAESNSEKRCSVHLTHSFSIARRQTHGILQNLIKSDEIPEFQIPPELCERNKNRRHTDSCATVSLDTSRETGTVQRRSLPLTAGCLRDSAALPGFFTNTGLSLESLNIRTLCDHVRESTEAGCNVHLHRRESAVSICQEKHLQDLDLASLHSFQSAGERKSSEDGTTIRLFVFEQILTLREDYEKLRGKNVLVRYRKMSDMLENCVRSCRQLTT